MQDVEPILERNAWLRAESQKSDWGRHIASIPNVILVRWMNEDGVNVLGMSSEEWGSYIRRKLGDPDWRHLRVDRQAACACLCAPSATSAFALRASADECGGRPARRSPKAEGGRGGRVHRLWTALSTPLTQIHIQCKIMLSRAPVDRPTDLPDFRNPPLNEVVLGVQFSPARGYSQIRAGEVWALYKSKFPLVEEQPPLTPVFETFGRLQPMQMNLGIITGASHDRFWFLTPEKDELIQFQEDRLLHNWRKVGEGTNEYPRFERMIEKFERELGGLEGYFATLSPQTLAINQCEVTYVNHIPWTGAAGNDASRWLRFLQFGDSLAEEFSITFRRTIPSPTNQPIGRLICEASAALADGKRVIRLSLTARGAPARPDVSAALDFLQRGREIVVRAFAQLTTEAAHQEWQRVQ